MLTEQEKRNLLDYFSRKNQKHVCVTCYNYFTYKQQGYCACREQVDMIRLTNQCPDWRKLDDGGECYA